MGWAKRAREMMVELKMSYDPQTGMVSVNGPLHQMVLCLGILEVAKLTVIKANSEGEQKLVQPAILAPGFGQKM